MVTVVRMHNLTVCSFSSGASCVDRLSVVAPICLRPGASVEALAREFIGMGNAQRRFFGTRTAQLARASVCVRPQGCRCEGREGCLGSSDCFAIQFEKRARLHRCSNHPPALPKARTNSRGYIAPQVRTPSPAMPSNSLNSFGSPHTPW